MVSSATCFGEPLTCLRTLLCRSGAMLARKTCWELRNVSGSLGLKSAKTFSSVIRVSRSFRCWEYFRDQKKDLPAARFRPAVLILRFFKMAALMAEESSPHIKSGFSVVKKLVATG